ncbi:transporter substrate-binding domain-containing protein [Nitrogeniibacter mangrovi]|uniref:Transporter substrate-binding domain-containing protein n=1 Tax=Nitrogeniibacter mangrovi TaxID=2016596 RepID=A0A6C1B726_9RHOO|nr:transporter substrate-binding domain-containing protein [Nitrogeniibacter mangrovi]QID18625.1 transporter substrate-binding domain-containing protein [Nitrogeniibacter mangrovi]
MTRRFLLALLCATLMLPALAARAQMRFSVVEDAVLMQISERVLQEAYRQIGLSFELEAYPGARSLRYAEAGFVDGEVARLGGLEKTHPTLLRVPVAINRLEAVAFTRDVQLSVHGWPSLKPYRVGIRRGVPFAERAAKRYGLDSQIADSVEQLFRLLDAGRVDVVVVSRLNGLEALDALGDTGVQALSPPVDSFPLFHYLHARHRDLLPAITAALRKMDGTGRIRQIRETFIAQRFGKHAARATP